MLEKNKKWLTLTNVFTWTEADGMNTQRGWMKRDYHSKHKDMNPVDDGATVVRGRDVCVTRF